MSQNKLPTFSKSHFRGTLVILTILVSIFVLPDIIVYCSSEEPFDISLLPREEADAYRKVNKRTKYGYNFRKKESRYLTPPEKFNPNDYTADQWMALGLSQKQANVILKFTKRRLRSNDDLRKIFVINEEFFAIIKDSTFYDEQTVSNYDQDKPFDRAQNKRIQVDLNVANEEELMKVPGIGAFFAKQIVKKRNELGGYIRLEQLLEVWKVDQEKLDQWTPHLTLSSGNVHYLNLNTATAEELQKHPYISWNLANSLVKLRLQKGGYKRVEDCKQSVLMTDELYLKLKPYFTVE